MQVTNPLQLDNAADIKYRWIGYCSIAPQDRLIIEEGGLVYIYISLETACRFIMNPTDERYIETIFHPEEVHDNRLAGKKRTYLHKIKQTLKTWDHSQ
jgi:hypothetical protein